MGEGRTEDDRTGHLVRLPYTRSPALMTSPRDEHGSVDRDHCSLPLPTVRGSFTSAPSGLAIHDALLRAWPPTETVSRASPRVGTSLPQGPRRTCASCPAPMPGAPSADSLADESRLRPPVRRKCVS